MNEKRFIVIDVPYENGEPFLCKKMLDKTTKKEYDNTLKGIDDICDLTNKLHTKNEWLKFHSKGYVKRYSELFNEYKKTKKENERLKQELKEFKDYVFSDEEILCYSCVNCISKGIYEVECSEKGKVDVHSSCFLYWKNEVRLND